jgi:hypothetical protein
MGAPEVPYTDTLGGEAPQGPINPGIAPDPRGAIMAGLTNPMMNRDVMKFDMSSLDKADTRKDQAAQRLFEIERKAKDKLEQIREAATQGRISKAEADARHSQLLKELADTKRSMGGTPYFTPVTTTLGVGSFDNRIGQMKIISGPDGQALVKPTDSPSTQAAIAQGKETGKETGKANEAQFQSATAAADNIAKIDQLTNHLKSSNAITGMGADFLKNVERAKAMVTGSIAAGKTVSDTEIADVMMGSEVFPLIKELGIGARGMDTPAEREFMRNVLTGTVSLNKETLLRMAELRKNVAQRAINRWNDRVQKGEVDDYFKFSGRTKGPIGGQKVIDFNDLP